MTKLTLIATLNALTTLNLTIKTTLTTLNLILTDPHDSVALLIQYLCRSIVMHLQLVLLSYHPIFLRPYHFLKLISFLGANRTKSASVCLWLLRGAI